ncbi:MAG: PSD1 and planctomycete cytochrome C domain-containing protein [Pirellulales bacterium]
MTTWRWTLAGLLLAVTLTESICAGELSADTKLDPATVEFFEREVRPVLVTSCLECHGPDKQESELRLDSHADMLKGSVGGAVVVPGQPAESRLVTAIRYDGDIQMPPAARLPEKSIAALTRWVEMGAPWPPAEDRLQVHASANQHWAFQPVRQPPLPAVRRHDWIESPVDQFTLSRLESAGLEPSPPADRRTLLRRLSFDLIGLPPTSTEIAAFEADSSPQAVDRAIERLLNSSHFGERWARYWLDLARYSDTKGYVFTEDRAYKYAYVFRDWVIESFNEDLPYDQFLMQQVAGDQLRTDADPSPLAALGYLTVGRRFLNNQPDIIDDRIDVVTRGMMGLTVGCARCHDHKYDPIPTADYYSLYGVFAASQETMLPLETPTAEYQAELDKREGEVRALLETKQAELQAELVSNPGPFLAAAWSENYSAKDPSLWKQPGLRDPSPRMVERWKGYLQNVVKADHPVFGPWQKLSGLKEADYPAGAAELCQQLARNEQTPAWNPLVAEMLAGFEPRSFDEVIDRYSTLLVCVHQQWQQMLAEAQSSGSAAPQALPLAAAEQLRQVLYGADSPAVFSQEDAERLLRRDDREQLRGLRGKVTEWMNSDRSPRHAMALTDRQESVANPRIFVRGNPNNQGDEVPRQFLKLISGDSRQPFQQGSGRLELAKAIVSPDNPLTARVWVNRVWDHLFGQGLVDTPSDFGTRSQPPSHPELLDYLAARFMAEGWSTKWLIGEIVRSATYRQSSAPRPECQAVDPENRLLWRMNGRRLDFESLRDSLLAVSGTLDTKVLGTSVDINGSPFPTRRTVYSYIDRQNLPGLFRTFDFASPDAHTPRRFQTTVPQQALFLMNHPFVVEKAQQTLQRPEIASAADPAARIASIYQTLFGRSPTDDEMKLGESFVHSGGAGAESDAWARYVQALMMSNEFIFVD